MPVVILIIVILQKPFTRLYHGGIIKTLDSFDVFSRQYYGGRGSGSTSWCGGARGRCREGRHYCSPGGWDRGRVRRRVRERHLIIKFVSWVSGSLRRLSVCVMRETRERFLSLNVNNPL